jgi:tRNA (guanosine-2'-O-)-methyltransferase
VRRDEEGTFEVVPSRARYGAHHWDALCAEGWTAEGVIQLLEPLVFERRREVMRRVVEQRVGSVVVVLDAPHDPRNGAAIIRTCDAFGIQDLYVVARREPFLISHKITQGTERWVDVHCRRDPGAAATELGAKGYELVGTHPDGKLQPEDLASIPRLGLVFGNEHQGICPELGHATRHSVRVPMRGFVESLNLSVTAGILLAAATRTRAGDLPEPARLRLYARGLLRSVSRAGDVLAASQPR